METGKLKETNKAKRDFLQDLIGITLILSLICILLDHIYVPREAYEKVLFESYYEQDNIDNIFMLFGCYGSTYDVQQFIYFQF